MSDSVSPCIETGAPLEGMEAFEGYMDALSMKDFNKIAFATAHGESKGFLEWAQGMETIRVCSRCRLQSGCDRCSFLQAARFVLRWGQVPSWWNMIAGEAARTRWSFAAVSFRAIRTRIPPSRIQ